MVTNCIFCKIAAGTIPTDFLAYDDDVFVIRDVNPQAPVHLLVIPFRHIQSMGEVTPHDAKLLGRMTLLAKSAATAEGIGDQGYRLVINCGEDGGQTVGHLHMHVLGGRQLSGLG